MFNPCKPCVCADAPCEQCMFGYRSAESNHKSMLELITAVKNGEKPFGWKCAQNYMDYHENWEEELKQYLDGAKEEEVKESETVEVIRVNGVIGEDIKDFCDRLCAAKKLYPTKIVKGEFNGVNIYCSLADTADTLVQAYHDYVKSHVIEEKEDSNPNFCLTIDLGPEDNLTNFRVAEAVHNLCSRYEDLDASTVSCMLGDQARFDTVLKLKGE